MNHSYLIFIFSILLSFHANAGDGPSRAENFALIDHEGKSHELDYYLKMKGVKGLVVFVQGKSLSMRFSQPGLMRFLAYHGKMMRST